MLIVFKNFLKCCEEQMVDKLLIFNQTKLIKVRWRSFFKEGMYIDSLQKLSLDKLISKLSISSTQFFNINYYNHNTIRFFLDSIYKVLNYNMSSGDDLNFLNAITNSLILFVWVIQFTLITYFLFLF